MRPACPIASRSVHDPSSDRPGGPVALAAARPHTEDVWAGRRLHFVGIGGAGMSGLALIALALGASVTGSDRAPSSYTRRLREHGIEPVFGHAAANVPAGAEVVYSTAIPSDNPERVAATRELHRADLLAEVAALRRCLAVTGTHGKTTTSGMAVQALRGAGLDPPTWSAGSCAPPAPTRRGGPGNGSWSRPTSPTGRCSSSQPEIAVLTNAELDHHATYDSGSGSRGDLRHVHGSAPATAPWSGTGRGCGRCAQGGGRPLRRPRSASSHPGGSRFDWRGIEVELSVPGAHNAVNAAGALTACALAGADPAAAAAALADFSGARRRMERLGDTAAGAEAYDDYAHHPTEVAAAIAAARTLAPRRLVAVFQPHLYSRTRALARGFGQALAGADLVVVLGIYPARERARTSRASPDGWWRSVPADAVPGAGRSRGCQGSTRPARS